MRSYRVHKLAWAEAKDPANLELFLNSLTGEVISIMPHVTMRAFWVHGIDYLLITEKLEVEVDAAS
jgi:hypothetical protein